MMKILIISTILLIAMIAPAMADDLGFDDFKPDNPIQTLKDIGIWDIVSLIIAVVFGLAIVAVIVGLAWSVARIGLSAMKNDAQERKDGMAAMVGIIGGVLLFVCMITALFFVWAML